MSAMTMSATTTNMTVKVSTARTASSFHIQALADTAVDAKQISSQRYENLQDDQDVPDWDRCDDSFEQLCDHWEQKCLRAVVSSYGSASVPYSARHVRLMLQDTTARPMLRSTCTLRQHQKFV